jgi:hypothetical protein
MCAAAALKLQQQIPPECAFHAMHISVADYKLEDPFQATCELESSLPSQHAMLLLTGPTLCRLDALTGSFC